MGGYVPVLLNVVWTYWYQPFDSGSLFWSLAFSGDPPSMSETKHPVCRVSPDAREARRKKKSCCLIPSALLVDSLCDFYCQIQNLMADLTKVTSPTQLFKKIEITWHFQFLPFASFFEHSDEQFSKMYCLQIGRWAKPQQNWKWHFKWLESVDTGVVAGIHHSWC